MFSIWSSDNSTVVSCDPKANGWKYVGVYGAGGRGGMGASGTSMQFTNNLKCRHLLLLTDGKWQGNDYLKTGGYIYKTILIKRFIRPKW